MQARTERHSSTIFSLNWIYLQIISFAAAAEGTKNPNLVSVSFIFQLKTNRSIHIEILVWRFVKLFNCHSHHMKLNEDLSKQIPLQNLNNRIILFTRVFQSSK